MDAEKPTLTCPCCGYIVIYDTCDICPICGWEYDPVQADDVDDANGPNQVSLRQAQNNYRTYGSADHPPLVPIREPGIDDRKDPLWNPLS